MHTEPQSLHDQTPEKITPTLARGGSCPYYNDRSLLHQPNGASGCRLRLASYGTSAGKKSVVAAAYGSTGNHLANYGGDGFVRTHGEKADV